MNLTVLRAGLSKLVYRLNREARRGDIEWMASSRWPGLCLAPAPEKCTQIVYLTKGNGLLGVPLDDDRLVGHATILSRWGSIGAPLAQRVLAEGRSARVPVEFVGDLDPHDLTVYLMLACSQRDSFSRVKYTGVGDEWLRLCRRYARPLGLPTIEMNAFEKKHLDWLLQLPMEWDQVVGSDALTLLRSGHKLELEGATNPAFYRAGFSKRLARHLFGSRRAASMRSNGVAKRPGHG